MSFRSKILGTREQAASTALGAWKKLFSAGQSPDRSAVTVRSFGINATDIWLAVLPSGSSAPTEPVDSTDETNVDYRLSPGDTYVIDGRVATIASDVWIRDAAGQQLKYNAWESREQG